MYHVATYRASGPATGYVAGLGRGAPDAIGPGDTLVRVHALRRIVPGPDAAVGGGLMREASACMVGNRWVSGLVVVNRAYHRISRPSMRYDKRERRCTKFFFF